MNLLCICLLTAACNREMQPFFFIGYSLGGDILSLGSKFNCAAHVGLGQTFAGMGRVWASILSPCRPLRHRPK